MAELISEKTNSGTKCVSEHSKDITRKSAEENKKRLAELEALCERADHAAGRMKKDLARLRDVLDDMYRDVSYPCGGLNPDLKAFRDEDGERLASSINGITALFFALLSDLTVTPGRYHNELAKLRALQGNQAR